MLGTAKQWGRAVYKAGMSALLGGNLVSLTMVGHPRRLVEYWQNCLFYWQLATGRGLPQKQLHEILPLESATEVTMLATNGHFVAWEPSFAKDAMYMALISRVLKPVRIFEIGTLYGYTARLFAANSTNEAQVFTLDLPPEAEFSLQATLSDVTTRAAHHQAKHLEFHGTAEEAKIQILLGDSARFDYAPWRGQIDLFFIDGSHSYEYVRSDTKRALESCHPGSIILWHDYGRWGVNGVSRFLHEFAISYPELSRLPGSSLAILRVPEGDLR